MNEKKTIHINPEIFRFQTTNKTRRKNTPTSDQNKPIKIKTVSKPVSSKTVKNRLLKYIRQQQDANYKQLSVTHTPTIPQTHSSESGFESDFEDSLKYLSSIAEKTHQPKQSEYKGHGSTLRHFPPTTESLLYGSTFPNSGVHSDIGLELPNVFDTLQPTHTENAIILRNTNSNVPKFGCLKNGNLPTYRMWKNQTIRAPHNGGNANAYVNNTSNRNHMIPLSSNDNLNDKNNSLVNQHTTIVNPTVNTPVSYSNGGKSREISEMGKHHERKIQHQQQRPKNMFRKLKQKRTLRRTYRVGKSKHHPNVSVLISNKTLRKQITTKSQLLKQVPMEDVKKTLIQKGFIKVGCTAPMDVLRKMYESVSLVCGDIQNHNPDNLLYNYLNGGHDKL